MKTKGMGIALLSTAALLGSAVAQAELPWTYAELGYNIADGVEDAETDAIDIKGSIAFLEKWHASLAYLDGEVDVDGGNDVDFDGFRVVVGAHPQLTQNTQLITDLTYFDYELDDGGSDPGSDGFGVGFGLRHALTDKFELMAEVWYLDGEVDSGSDDGDFNDTTVEIGGRYNWTSNLSTGLTVFLNNYPGLPSLAGISTTGDVARFDVRWAFGDVF